MSGDPDKVKGVPESSPRGGEPEEFQILPAPPREADPWAHRRGEPRTFGLLWTIYLVSACAVSFGGMGVLRPDMSVIRSTARLVLLIGGVGIALLWPLTRLSQVRPRSRGAGLLKDAIVLLVPFQAVVWPLTFMADWPWRVVLCVDAAVAAWAFFMAAIIAWALQEERSPGPAKHGVRTAAMAVCVAAIGGGPMLGLLLERLGAVSPESRGWRMSSLPSSIREITADRPWVGRGAAVEPVHWMGVLGVAGAGAAAWAGVLTRRLVLRRRAGLD